MTAPTHRKTPSRAALPRRTTRGPLDEDDDPLSATLSPISPSSRTSALGTPIIKSQDLNPLDRQLESHVNSLAGTTIDVASVIAEKNLSFLLDAAIYHPLGQVDVPSPFRRPFLPPPKQGATTTQALEQLDALLAQCDFLGAAHYAAMFLTGGLVRSTDHATIFRLLATRYSCLELLGQTLLAAQEAKALEDLTSEFYYITPDPNEPTAEQAPDAKPIPSHVMPFSLRVQALRLQSIGFSDPRRGITALYDLGLEMREHLASPYTSERDREEYRMNLESIGIHVVNSLIELGDLDCAQRTLAQIKPQDEKSRAQWTARKVLLLIKLGQTSKASELIDEGKLRDNEKAILKSIVLIADGELADAADILNTVDRDDSLGALAKSNLAIAYLYTSHINDGRTVLEELVKAGYSFQALTVNLATIYDLSSDKSKDLKHGLADRLAASQTRTKAFTNADFKL